MFRTRAFLMVTTVSLAVLLAGQPATAAPPDSAVVISYTYPITVPGPQVDTYFGTAVPDPYRWLENPDSPQTKAWVQGQRALATAYLASLPSRSARHAQLTGLVDYDVANTPTQVGRKLFWLARSAGQDQPTLYYATGHTGRPHALLDANRLSSDGTVGLVDWSPSWNAKYLAYAVSESGSDWETIRVRNVATGRDQADIVEWVKFSGIGWDPESTGFYYSRYPKPKNPLEAVNKDQKLYFHRLGTSQSQDALVYADAKHPDRTVWAGVDPTARMLWLSTSEAAGPNNRLYYQHLAGTSRPLVALFDDGKAEYYPVGQRGSRVWLQTNRDATNRQVVSFDLRHPARRNWKVVIAERPDTMESASSVGNRLVATYLKDATDRVRLFDYSGKEMASAPLPGLGTASGFDGCDRCAFTYYTFSSYTSPRTVMRLNVHTGQSTVWRRAVTTFDTSAVTTDQVFVTSKDGTRVPAFVVHRKDVTPTGDNPTLLTGYGGFGVSITPSYTSQIAAWVQSGGIYVEAVLRGGGEYGYDWYESGTLLKKRNVFDDFIATAQWLIDNGWTRSSRLAIKGESNGGLLIGAVMTQRPDLIGAALPGVGVLDMLRYQEFTIGTAWAGDYGLSSDSAEMFTYLLGYSPLHNVKPGVSYPATLITTGDHDDRVVPAHSYKFAATLQADNASQNPIIIRIDTDSGHGGGAALSQTVDTWTDELAFLDATVGSRPVVPAPTFSRAAS